MVWTRRPGTATPRRFSPEKNYLQGLATAGPEKNLLGRKEAVNTKVQPVSMVKLDTLSNDPSEQASFRERQERGTEENVAAVSQGPVAGNVEQESSVEESVEEIYTMTHHIDEPSRQLRGEVRRVRELHVTRKVKVMLPKLVGTLEGKMFVTRKVKVMLPRLVSTLEGKMLVRFMQDYREILREQKRVMKIEILPQDNIRGKDE